MKAVQFIDGKIQTTEVDPIEPPENSEEWSILKVSVAGICGSDLHMANIKLFPPNMTIGHEFGGVLSDGRLATIEPIIACGKCDRCQEGRYNICDRIMESVSGLGRHGGMQEEVLVHNSQIVLLEDEAFLNNSCLVEPLAVCIHGFERLNFSAETYKGLKVAVIGGGTIGQCALAVAKSYGADVSLFSRHNAQAEAAEKLGATARATSGDQNDSGKYDLVIEAAGTESALKQAVNLARSGAKILLLAMYWEPVAFPGTEVCMKEVDIIPAIMYCGGRENKHHTDFMKAVELLSKTPQLPEAIITHRFGISEASHAFEVAGDRKSGAIKVVLDPLN